MSTTFNGAHAKKKGNYNIKMTRPAIMWFLILSLSISCFLISLLSIALLLSSLNLNQKTFLWIYTSFFETEVLYISRVFLRQLFRYKLQGYSQINAFPIDGCGIRKTLLYYNVKVMRFEVIKPMLTWPINLIYFMLKSYIPQSQLFSFLVWFYHRYNFFFIFALTWI